MKERRWHYPPHLRNTQTIPYHNTLPIEPDSYREALTFNYTIKVKFHRQHCNPPLWTDLHFHTFEVTLELEAVCQPRDLYGLDMVEVENQLYLWAEQLPEIVNEHPLCPHGTTEEMCLYFTKIPVDSHIKILSASVSETPNRVTTLKLQ